MGLLVMFYLLILWDIRTMESSNNYNKRLVGLTAGCGVLLCSQLSFGQALEEVIVTAQKRSQNLQDVPLTISAFSAEKISDYGITDIKSLAAVTPGLVVSSTQGSPAPYIRGVGTRLSGIGLGPSISVYVDDRYVGASGASLEMPDIERVEVLKGPQGTLYGRNSIGGTLRIITKDPGEEWAGSVEATVGNYNQRDLEGIIGGPVTDNFRLQVAAAQYNRDGYADNLVDTSPLSTQGNDEYDDRDAFRIRTKAIWDITEDVSLKLTSSWAETDDTNGFRQNSLDAAPVNIGLSLGAITGDDGSTVAHSTAGNAESESYYHDLALAVSFENFDFLSLTTYSDSETTGIFENDGGSINWLGGATSGEGQTFSQEFRATSNGDEALQWIVAAEYYDTEANAALTAASFRFPGRTAALGLQTVNTESLALLAKLTYSFSDQWVVSAGARYTDESKEQTTDDLATGVINFSGGPLPFESEDSWTELTPTITIQNFTDSGMFYFTYSQGFKSGGFNNPANSLVNGSVTPILEPEILDNFELGYKGEFYDGRLRLNGAAYYYDYTDLQVTRAAGSGNAPVLVTENAADASVVGLEMDFSWLATDQLVLSGGFNALDTEYKDYDASAKIPCREVPTCTSARGAPAGSGYTDVFYDASGDSLLRAPELTAFLSARYGFKLETAEVPLVVSYSYSDDFFYDFSASDSTSELEQDAVGLLQARLSYVPDEGSWQVSLWGNNLTDEEYYSEKVANGSSLRVNYQPPRTYGVDVRYDF
ncbi:MAG: iron complex outermembrane receptor protein [Chitinophagales bacterium]